MIHVRNLVKSRGDGKNASSGLASASVSLSSGQRILVLDPKDGISAQFLLNQNTSSPPRRRGGRSRGGGASRTFACFAPGSGRNARGSGPSCGARRDPGLPGPGPKDLPGLARPAPPGSPGGAASVLASRRVRDPPTPPRPVTGWWPKASLGTLGPAVPTHATHQKPRRA